jgi:hypothetical protein
MKKTDKKPDSPKIVLSDSSKKTKRENLKGKKSKLSGKDYDTLNAAGKETLNKAALELLGLIDENNIVI